MLTTLRTGLTNWIATKRGDAEHDAADGARWRRFGKALFGTFIGGLAACAAFILIVDPYQVVPFSPPMPRPERRPCGSRASCSRCSAPPIRRPWSAGSPRSRHPGRTSTRCSCDRGATTTGR